MNNYYSTVLYPFAEKLVRLYDKQNAYQYNLSVDDISETDQLQFAKHFIEYDDRDLLSIYENNNYDDIISSLIKSLASGKTEDKIDFTDNVQKNIVAYYKPKMQEMIDEVLGWQKQQDRIDCTPHHYQDNDEIYWRRGA